MNIRLNELTLPLLIIFCLPLTAQAFYEWQNDNAGIELKGLIRAAGAVVNNPNDNVLFNKDKFVTGGAFARLMLDAEINELSFEAHAVQTVVDKQFINGGRRFSLALSNDRSDALRWQYADDHAILEIDRLNVQYSGEQFDLKVGRQALNLATTYYFTPNDFFAPFAAQIFFRTYKPGVDAARLNWQLGALSQVSLYSVLTYPVDASFNRSHSPDWSETAYLARASTLINTFEVAILAGQEQGDEIIGVDFQGELFEWLGVRGEGHLRTPDESNQPRDIKMALGIEHRFENTLTLRWEKFYQRSGAESVQDYLITPPSMNNNRSFYLAEHYSAVGASYEITPLLTSDAVWIYNHKDTSSLFSLYTLYSLSDESELAISVNLPIGDQPVNGVINSEFGSYPKSINVEYRVYF